MSDQDTRLQTLLDWLERGRISGQDAAAQVAKMKFPAPARPSSEWDKITADVIGDPESEPGGFTVVSQAHAAGKISDEQYEALAKAAAGAVTDGSG